MIVSADPLDSSSRGSTQYVGLRFLMKNNRSLS